MGNKAARRRKKEKVANKYQGRLVRELPCKGV
jgi:hypothetical protein